MQDLMIELNSHRKMLNTAITELRKRGQAKAEAEKNYRVALQQEILKLRAEGYPATLINDLARGKKEIAELKMQRDIAETMWESAMQKIYQCKLEMGIIE